MPDPRWEAGLGKAGRLLRQNRAQPGVSEDSSDFRVSQTESNRRVEDAIPAAAEQQTPAGTPILIASEPAKVKPPEPPVVIDRLHKESLSFEGGYIFVGKNHDTSETDQMPPVNPGYASATASSLNDAYKKALAFQPRLKANARITIYVMSGTWIEDLTLMAERIDWVGMGRPVIWGRVMIANIRDIRMTGIEFRSRDLQEAVRVTIAPPPEPTFLSTYSLTKFFDCWFHGDQRALWTQRRIYLEGCRTWADTDTDPGLENPPFIVTASPDDIDFTVSVDCTHTAFLTLDMSIPRIMPPGVRRPVGYAIRVMGQTGPPPVPGLEDKTDAYLLHPMSGLLIRRGTVEGSLLCEQSVVLHEGGFQLGGLPSLTKSGGVYAIIRGRRLDEQQIPGIVQFDHAQTRAGLIAMFMSSPEQPGVLGWGGAVYYRSSNHTCGYDGAEAAAVVNMGSVGEFYHDNQSATACPVWGGAGITFYEPDLTTGANVPLSAMFNPYRI